MFKFNNTHIFTGYLKQLLSSFNLPTCKIYTREYAEYAVKNNGKEDPKVIKSFDSIVDSNDKTKNRSALRINYLKNNELYCYTSSYEDKELSEKAFWKRSSAVFYESDKHIPGLTRVLNSPGVVYDTKTHEYLGEYLRFLRDFHSVDLMSLYNCFNNRICNNIYYKFRPYASQGLSSTEVVFDSQDKNYRIYAFPVKLFSSYTIAIDCNLGVEMFCGFYNTKLDGSDKSCDLIAKTYEKHNKTIFKQPFLYNKLSVQCWGDQQIDLLNESVINRYDIASREQDLKLFIKIPASCRSSITILEGDFRSFNDFKYVPTTRELTASDGTTLNKTVWEYNQNHAILNFSKENDINKTSFKPIGKLQLLAFNTEESYPFADRLVEYLSNSAITPIDEIADNIKRVQEVMSQNQHYFKIGGLWEDKMQKIIYDYIMCSGPIQAEDPGEQHSVKNNNAITPKNTKVKLVDKRRGLHPGLGHSSKSTVYDILGYVDRDAEKWYASWKIDNSNGKAVMRDNIQSVDIYNGLFDL